MSAPSTIPWGRRRIFPVHMRRCTSQGLQIVLLCILLCAVCDSISSPQGQRHGGMTSSPTMRVPPSASCRVEVAGACIPHPDKAATGGEDAHFILDGTDFGVFDGVGGWTSLGFNPGEYTRTFCSLVKRNITQQRELWDAGLSRSGPATFKGVDLTDALEEGLQGTPGVGSCTACIASFDGPSGLLSVANLGDSGAILLRPDLRGQLFVALRTSPQQYAFNQPFQLGTNSTNRPCDAQIVRARCRPGDVIITATDGLLDNLFDEEIAEEVYSLQLSTKRPVTAEQLVKHITALAYRFSADKSRQSPWQLASVENMRKTGRPSDESCTGGKMDDITAVVGIVSAMENLQPFFDPWKR